MCVTTSTIAAGRNASTSSTPFHGPPFARRKSPSPISWAIPIASTATSSATRGASSPASTAVRPRPTTACSSHPPQGDLPVLLAFTGLPRGEGYEPRAIPRQHQIRPVLPPPTDPLLRSRERLTRNLLQPE